MKKGTHSGAERLFLLLKISLGQPNASLPASAGIFFVSMFFFWVGVKEAENV